MNDGVSRVDPKESVIRPRHRTVHVAGKPEGDLFGGKGLKEPEILRYLDLVSCSIVLGVARLDLGPSNHDGTLRALRTEFTS